MADDATLDIMMERLSALLRASEQRTFEQLDKIYDSVSQQRNEIQDLAASVSGATRTRMAQQEIGLRQSTTRNLSNKVVREASVVQRTNSLSLNGVTTETHRKKQLREARHAHTGMISSAALGNEDGVGGGDAQSRSGETVPSAEVCPAFQASTATQHKWHVTLTRGGVPSVVRAIDEEASRHCHPFVQRLIHSSYFDSFWLGVIILNAIFLGVQLEVYVTSGKHHDSNVIGETFFASMFIVEMFMRVLREGFREFFFGKAMGWALLDVFVVSISIFDIIVTYAQVPLGGFVSSVNILRMARCFRIAKVIRGIRFMRNLRLLLAGMANSVLAIIWTLVAVVFFMYMGSILVMSVVAEKIIEGGSYYVDTWGGVFRSMSTLFQVMSGDAWWSGVVTNLREDYPALQMFFIAYYCVTALGLLNIVTGIFVEQTLNTSKTDAELLMDETDEAKEAMKDFLTDVFDMMDRDHDGQVYFDEFEHFVEQPEVQFALERVHLKVNDVLNLFLLMDKSGDEHVDLTEFLDGCMRARGCPTTADVMEHGVRTRNLLLQVLKILEGITERLDNGYSDGYSGPEQIAV